MKDKEGSGVRLLLRSARQRVVLIGIAVATGLVLTLPASAALLSEGDSTDADIHSQALSELCDATTALTRVPARVVDVPVEISACDLRGVSIHAGKLDVKVPLQSGTATTASSVLTEDAPKGAVVSLTAINTGSEIRVSVQRVHDEARSVSRGQPGGRHERTGHGKQRSGLRATISATSGSTGAGAHGCSTEAYRYTGGRNDRLEWHFNRSSVPSYLPQQTAEMAIITAMETVTTGKNACGLGRLASTSRPEESYMGLTSRQANCNAPDGQSTVDFGSRPSETLATACWWYSTVDGVNRIFEADVRFRDSPKSFYYFEPDKCDGQYELTSIATHEFGHAFGLAHVSEERYPHQTMSPIAPECSYEQSSLARGDWFGLRNLYRD